MRNDTASETGRLDDTPRPASKQDIGRVGIAFFDRLGFNVLSDTAAARQTLQTVLPVAAGRSYLRTLIDAHHDGERVVAFSAADEARWLAQNLTLDALADDSDSNLGRRWDDACGRAGLFARDATTDPEQLYRTIETMLEWPGDSDTAGMLAGAIVRR
jgi:hypothetical protein